MSDPAPSLPQLWDLWAVGHLCWKSAGSVGPGVVSPHLQAFLPHVPQRCCHTAGSRCGIQVCTILTVHLPAPWPSVRQAAESSSRAVLAPFCPCPSSHSVSAQGSITTPVLRPAALRCITLTRFPQGTGLRQNTKPSGSS